jgi:hypothetical protein
MGTIIGGSYAYSTWAKLRTPIANWSISGSPVDQYDHSVDYLQGFRTTDGNGLLASRWQTPGFNLDSGGYFWSPGHDVSPIWTDKQKAQLIGESVSSSGSPFNISSSVFVSPWYQYASGANPISSIGKLTAF